MPEKGALCMGEGAGNKKRRVATPSASPKINASLLGEEERILRNAAPLPKG